MLGFRVCHITTLLSHLDLNRRRLHLLRFRIQSQRTRLERLGERKRSWQCDPGLKEEEEEEEEVEEEEEEEEEECTASEDTDSSA